MSKDIIEDCYNKKADSSNKKVKVSVLKLEINNA